MITTLDLFSGIGGFSLGLEATGGFCTQAFVEIEPFCQKVLCKHWPKVPLYSDIRNIQIKEKQFKLLCGGFPCQDVSTAGGKVTESILGDRSGLWFEYYRLIKEGKPTWVIIENVKNLRNKGLAIILSQLAEVGYDAEWNIIPAYGAGSPHVRERLWVVAHLISDRIQGNSPFPLQGLRGVPWGENGRRAADLLRRPSFTASALLRSSNGIPNYVDRIRALGNSIIPGIAYLVGCSILEYEQGILSESNL